MAPDPAVATCRLAVRRTLRGLDGGAGPVLVACSGGADSLAVLAAAVFESRGRPWPVVGVTVDHGLQPGSAERAHGVLAQMRALGADTATTVRVRVEAAGEGPEAAARHARYAALSGECRAQGGRAVLLGHTRDDQAETVLLGLARGSGARSLAGMRRTFDHDGVGYARPLIEVSRAETEAACRAEGIDFWADPHNADPRFARSRARHRVLPVLERELGPGVVATLARTADQLREDADALDDAAERALREAWRDDAVYVPALRGAPAGIATRVLRRAALSRGAPASELFRVHVLALADLLPGPAGSHGQVQLPGLLTAYRDGDYLRFRRTAVGG